MINWVTFFSIIFTLALSYYIILHYSSRTTNKLVYISVFLGLATAFSLIGLVPYDIYITKHSGTSDQKTELFIMWQVLFWTSFLLCWILLPILRNYDISGDFHWKGRLKSAIKAQLKELIIVGIIGLALLVFVLAKSIVNIKDLPQILAFLSNTWGLFLIMVFLGYGLVAVPRYFWLMGNSRSNLDFLYVKLINVDEEVTLASGNLDDVVKKICAACIKVPKDSMLTDKLTEVFNLCPASLRELHISRAQSDSSLLTGLVTQATLIDLHASLKSCLIEYRRCKCEWSKCIKEIITLEDILKSESSLSKRVNFTLSDSSTRSSCYLSLQWYYHNKLKPSLCQATSLFCALLSLLVIIGECTMAIDLPIGVFPLLVQQDLGFYLTQLLALFPLSYIIFCCYFAFFKLKLPGLYGMYSKNTEPSSFTYCAFYLTRISAPLALNFFYLVKVTDAVFWDVLVSPNAVGDIFEVLNTFFPVTLLVFSLLNYLNTYSRILSLLGVNQLSFIDQEAAYKVKEGRALAKRERLGIEKDLKEKKVSDWEMSSMEVLRDSGYAMFKV